jgi:hypothetical protein
MELANKFCVSPALRSVYLSIIYIARLEKYVTNWREVKYDTTLKKVPRGQAVSLSVSLLKICCDLELMDAERNRPCHNHVSHYVVRDTTCIAYARRTK